MTSELFILEEDNYDPNDVIMAQTNEFASTVMMKNKMLVSRYGERVRGGFNINEVKLNVVKDPRLELKDFYFD